MDPVTGLQATSNDLVATPTRVLAAPPTFHAPAARSVPIGRERTTIRCREDSREILDYTSHIQSAVTGM